jgi:hypothetical protein
MLDSAGYSRRDVQLRRHDFAGLPHLQIVGRVARIDGGAQLVGQRFDDLAKPFRRS